VNYTSALTGKEAIAEDTMAFRLQKPEGFTFRPGQHIDIASPAGGTSDFSIASSPNDDHLLIAMRLRGSDFKKSFAELPLGAPISFRGPLGSFALHEDTSRPALLLAGGIGITPFLSMARYAASLKLAMPLFLFYSNRSRKSAAFLDDLFILEKQNPNFTFVPTMSGEDGAVEDWNGERGYITMDLIHRHVPHREGAFYYIAGPTNMVDALHNLLKTVHIPEGDIRPEEFKGY
jgi:ferredoxin-NADP reductase